MHEIKPQPNSDVIASLERMLERAKTGNIRSIAYIYSTSDRCTGNGWSGMDDNNMGVIGELRVLERDLIDKLVDIRIDPQTGEDRY